jgi:hypothetical protein
MALVEGPRLQTAEDLWPELSSTAAARNLRVTLSYFLDVIEPDRLKGEISRFVIVRGSAFGFRRDDSVTIDVWNFADELQATAEAIESSQLHLALAHARRLVRMPSGAVLGGAVVGDWFAPYGDAQRVSMLRVVGLVGPRALELGDPELALDLARLGLSADRWAERVHQLRVRSHLDLDDLDGARQALRQRLSALDDLGVVPEVRTRQLAAELGIQVRLVRTASPPVSGKKADWSY